MKIILCEVICNVTYWYTLFTATADFTNAQKVSFILFCVIYTLSTIYLAIDEYVNPNKKTIGKALIIENLLFLKNAFYVILIMGIIILLIYMNI
jgi:hypothetical protein